MTPEHYAEAIILVLKRIVKWVAYASLALFVLALVVGAGFYAKDRWETRRLALTELDGVKLGGTLSDARFMWGDLEHGFSYIDKAGKHILLPTNIEDGPVKFDDTPHGDDGGWREVTNDQKDISIRSIEVLNGRIAALRFTCGSDHSYKKFNGIYCGDGIEKILDRFGDDVQVYCEKKKDYVDETDLFLGFSDLSRSYVIQKDGISYYLWKNKVKAFTLTAPGELRPELFGKELCR